MTAAKTYPPSSLVVALRSSFVRSLTNVTLALGTTAPCGSLMVPRTVALPVD